MIICFHLERWLVCWLVKTSPGLILRYTYRKKFVVFINVFSYMPSSLHCFYSCFFFLRLVSRHPVLYELVLFIISYHYSSSSFSKSLHSCTFHHLNYLLFSVFFLSLYLNYNVYTTVHAHTDSFGSSLHIVSQPTFLNVITSVFYHHFKFALFAFDANIRIIVQSDPWQCLHADTQCKPFARQEHRVQFLHFLDET